MKIYADKASLVGSIGVTAAGFGFVGAMDKLGIQRRAYTSGEHKAFLDPFEPEKPDETKFWQGVLNVTHEQFIASVKQGRGDRLKDKDHPELFSGLVWTGQQALPLGLIDGLGNASSVARDVIGEKSWLISRCKNRLSIASLKSSAPVSLSSWRCGWGFRVQRCADR